MIYALCQQSSSERTNLIVWQENMSHEVSYRAAPKKRCCDPITEMEQGTQHKTLDDMIFGDCHQ